MADQTPLTYGYKWFEYHANQRMTTFNYYLIIYSGLAAAYSFLLKEKIVPGSLLISTIMVLISVLFWQLDIRNRQLIQIGENIIDKNWIEVGWDAKLNPVTQSNALQSSGLRFRQIFNIVFLMGCVFGAAALVYALPVSG